MIIDLTDDFLEHYGVKGQKWGVRRKSKGRISEPNPKFMSDDQLRKAINRMEMQKKYKALTTEQKTHPGKKVANDLLKKAGMTLFGVAVSTGASLAVKKAMGAVAKT
jgi:hypothetical protein